MTLLAKEREERREFINNLEIKYKADLKQQLRRQAAATIKKTSKIKELQGLVNEMLVLWTEHTTNEKVISKSA